MTQPTSGGRAKAKTGRKPKAVDATEVAAILSYADLYDLQRAAEKFSVSTRSIVRWRAAVKSGAQPEVARLVEEKRLEASRRSSDLIVDTVDQLLRELQERKAKLSNEELIEAVEKVGNLRVTRDALTGGGNAATNVSQPVGDGRRTDADQPSPSPAARERPDGDGAGGTAGGSLEGRSAVH